jgi:DNA polymerase-2
MYKIAALESRWDIQLALPPLRVLRLRPDSDPFYRPPSIVTATIGPHTRRISAGDDRLLLWGLSHLLKCFDPDLILTDYGDTWLFPRLIEAAEAHRLPFNPSRDPERPYQRRGAFSYHTYGRIAHRGAQVHLYGRFHVDHMNATMYRQTGLHGIIEVTRLSGLPLQDVARKSPGAGITAMQMLVALDDDVLVPYEKAQVEDFKTPQELVRADRGGLVGQPVTGLHAQVAGIDFFSMYAQAMAHFNISPEKIAWQDGTGRLRVPGLGVYVDRASPGLVPKTVGPILDKRWAIKMEMAALDRRDCRYEPLKAYATALKWLLLVGFGYMGYKRFRWGRVEAHEAVTAFGRAVLLQAKETAEGLGYRVLYFNVDGLYVQKMDGGPPAQEELAQLLERIQRRTGLRIALDQVFEWIAFLPSRLDDRVPVANRYFGISRGPRGEAVLKIRGLAQRRHDTPEWVSQVQVEILERMSRAQAASQIAGRLPEIVDLVRARLRNLEDGRIPRRSLLASQVLSRELAAYRSPSPGARAALQLERLGRTLSPGQKVKFWYTRTPDGVTADGLPACERAPIDTKRYRTLLLRAVDDLLQPLGVDEETLQVWLGYGFAGHGAPSLQKNNGRQWALPLEAWR